MDTTTDATADLTEAVRRAQLQASARRAGNHLAMLRAAGMIKEWDRPRTIAGRSVPPGTKGL